MLAKLGSFDGLLAWCVGCGPLSSAFHMPVEPKVVCAEVLLAKQMVEEVAARLIC